MNKSISLKLHTDRLGNIRDVIRLLIAIEQVYIHLYALDLIIAETRKISKGFNEAGYSWRKKPVKNLSPIRNPDEIVLPQDRLQITSIVVKSPGFWEFLGSCNPLEVMRKYLCDRHERKKDISFRARQEEEKGELELEKLQVEVVRDKIEILKELGVSEEKIRKVIFTHVEEPFSQLDIYQDKGLFQDAEIVISESDKDDSHK